MHKPLNPAARSFCMDSCSINQQQQPSHCSQHSLAALMTEQGQTDLTPTGTTAAHDDAAATYSHMEGVYSGAEGPLETYSLWGQCPAQQQQTLAGEVAELTAAVAASFGVPSRFYPPSPEPTAVAMNPIAYYSSSSCAYSSSATPPMSDTTTTTTQQLSSSLWNPQVKPRVKATLGSTSCTAITTAPQPASPPPAASTVEPAIHAASTAVNAAWQGTGGYSKLPSPRDLQEFGFAESSPQPLYHSSQPSWQTAATKVSLPGHLLLQPTVQPSDNQFSEQQQVRQIMARQGPYICQQVGLVGTAVCWSVVAMCRAKLVTMQHIAQCLALSTFCCPTLCIPAL